MLGSFSHFLPVLLGKPNKSRHFIACQLLTINKRARWYYKEERLTKIWWVCHLLNLAKKTYIDLKK